MYALAGGGGQRPRLKSLNEDLRRDSPAEAGTKRAATTHEAGEAPLRGTRHTAHAEGNAPRRARQPHGNLAKLPPALHKPIVRL